MTKKKEKEVEIPVVIEDIMPQEYQPDPEEEHELYLLKEERLELLYLDAVIKNLELSVRLKDKEFNDAIALLQKRIGELQAQRATELNSLVEEKKTKIAELRVVKTSIETKYSFKLSECSFNEFTGQITVIPQ